jgi:hemolysin III
MTEELTDPLPTALHPQAGHALAEITPRLRGWMHLGAAPTALVAGVVLVGLSPAGPARAGSVVFVACALMLFSVSAAWHRGRWSPTVTEVLRRADHACIFLLIAGSYTPIALTLLSGRSRVTLLWVIWGGAALGIFFRMAWTHAPRWVCTPIYVALGWVAIPFVGDVTHRAGFVVVALLALGGLLYTAGGIVYGIRRPNPSPQWFGYHEVFHSLTVVAFVAHYTAVSIAAYSLR